MEPWQTYSTSLPSTPGRPTWDNLGAALHELHDTGRFVYELEGVALEAAMGEIPEARRFLGVMLIAREARLRRNSRGRPRRR